MIMIINNDCINCGACAVECPTEAIYEPDRNYELNGKSFDPASEDHFFIVNEICNECYGFDTIRCIAICPMDAFEIKEP